MAITSVGTGGTGVSSASSATFTLVTATNTINAADNRFAVLTVVADNTTTSDGQSSDNTSVTGGAGTWTKIDEYTNGNGAAAAGVTTALWLFVPNGANATGTVFTIEFASARVDKVASLWVFSKGAGQDVGIDTPREFSATDAATGFGSLSFSGLSSRQRLYFRGCGKEANSTTALTPSTNFTAITANRSRNNASAQIVRGEFRINTSTGETSSPTLAVTGDTSCVFAALIEVAASQGITPSLFTNAQTFFGPTIQLGAVGLTPSLYTNGQTFYAPTVAQGAAGQSLTPGLFTNGQTFFAPAVTATRTLTASLFDDGDTVFAPTVTRGTVTLTPVLFDDADTFFAATVGRGAVTLTPARFDDGDTFFAATVGRGAVSLTAARFDDEDTFYSATVGRGAVGLTPARFDDGDTFFAATVGRGAVNLTPAIFTDGDTFFAPTITQAGGTQALTASLYTDDDTFFGPEISTSSPQFLFADLFANAQQFPGAIVALRRELRTIRIGRGGNTVSIRRAVTGGAINRTAGGASMRRGATGRR